MREEHPRSGEAAEDRELIQWFIDGDQTAFEALYRKYARRLFTTAYRILGDEASAEDAVQDAFLNIYRALPRFRGEASFLSWAYRITVHRCLEVARAMPRHHAYEEQHSPVPTRVEQVLDDVVLREALRSLSPVYRAVLTLRYFEELSIEEVARTMGSTVAVTKMRLHRAKKQMAQALSSLVALDVTAFLEHDAPAALRPTSPSPSKETEMYAQLCQRTATAGATTTTGAAISLPALLTLGGACLALIAGGLMVSRHAAPSPTPPPAATVATAERVEPVERPVPAAVASALASDARLQQPITIQAYGNYVNDIVAAISAQTGVQLYTDPQIADQRLLIKMEEAPAAAVLTAISAQLMVEWETMGNGATPAYALSLTEHAAAEIAQAQQCQQFVARQEAEKNLRAVGRMLENGQYEDGALTTMEASLAREIKSILDVSPAIAARNPRYVYSVYADTALLSPSVISSLLTHGSYRGTYAELDPDHQFAFTEAISGIDPQPKSDDWYEYRLKTTETGAVMLVLEMAYHTGKTTAQQGSTKWLGALYAPGDLQAGAYQMAYGQDNPIAAVASAAADGNPAYADPRLDVPVTITPVEDNEYYFEVTLHDITRQLAEQTECNIVADYFALASYRQYFSRKGFPDTATLREWLAVLDRGLNIAWTLTDDQTLYLRHRNWSYLRQFEPPASVVKDALKTIQTHNTLSYTQLGQILALDETMAEAAYQVVSEQSTLDYTFYSSFFNLLHNGGKEYLIVWASLTPDQRRQAASEDGIAITELPESQRKICAEIASETGFGSQKDVINKPWHFRVNVEESSFLKTQALTGQQKRGADIFEEGTYFVLDLNYRGSARRDCRAAFPVKVVDGEYYLDWQ